MFKHSSFFLLFYWPFQGGASFFFNPFCYLCFVFVMMSCLFIATLWPPAENSLTSWLSCLWCFLVVLSLLHVVSCVRCDTWWHRFLILAFFLSFDITYSYVFLIRSNQTTAHKDDTYLFLPFTSTLAINTILVTPTAMAINFRPLFFWHIHVQTILKMLYTGVFYYLQRILCSYFIFVEKTHSV